MSPFVWAIITAYVFNPLIVRATNRTGLPRRLWVVLFFVGIIGLVVLGLTVGVPMLRQQFVELNRELPGNLREVGKLLGQNEIELLGVTVNFNDSDEAIGGEIRQVLTQVRRDVIPDALPRVAHTMLMLLIYFVSTFFILVQAKKITQNVRRFTPENLRAEFGPLFDRINLVLGAYIRGQVIIVALTTLATFIALQVLGVKYSLVLALFTGLVELIPFFGPYLSGGVAVLVALTQGSAPFGWTTVTLAIAVAVTYFVLRQIQDHMVMPLLIGKMVNLHPLTVIFSIFSGATLVGVLGMLLAVPVAASVKIVLTYLYGKFQEELPRTLVVVESGDSWETLSTRIREGMLVSKAEGASRPRLLISAPTPPQVLLDGDQFHRLPALLAEEGADASIVTGDEKLIGLSRGAGIDAGPQLEDEESDVDEDRRLDVPAFATSGDGRGARVRGKEEPGEGYLP